MYVLNCHITIGSYVFDFVHNVEVTSSWQEHTDKARITLPAALKIDSNTLRKSIPKGSKVVVKVGYDDQLTTIFQGFVSRVHPKVPVEIECEDMMWKLKQIQINENAKDETMQSYLTRVLGMEVDCFDIQLPKFIASKITGAQLLDQIKTDFGFPSFFRDGKLVVGKQYDPSAYSTHKIVLENASNSNVVTNNLEFMEKDDLKIKVTAISNLPDGSKHEIEIGDPDGESRSLNFYNISEADLKAVAEKEMQRLQYDGYRGSVVLFGLPLAKHGDVVEVINDQESDKTGNYWIDGVTYSFGVNGFRQDCKIGSRT